MIDQHTRTMHADLDGVPTRSDPPTRRKNGSIENRKAVWSLWAMAHWIVFSTITLSVIYLVVLLQ